MDVRDAIQIRRSVRAFAPTPLSDAELAAVKTALRSAPSACNYQPWKFILVTDPELRREVASACKSQMWLAAAPLIVVGCVFHDAAYKKMGDYYTSENVDLAIAFDHLTLTAVELGLGTCWIGAFNEAQMRPILGVPDNARIAMLMPVGHPAADDLNHPLDAGRRKTDADIFCQNRYR
jgi:nitroreductase